MHWPLAGSADGRLVAEVPEAIFCMLPLSQNLTSPSAHPNQFVIGTLSGDVYWLDVTKPTTPRRWRYHEDGAFAIVRLPAGEVVIAGGKGKLSRWSSAGEYLGTVVVDTGVRLRSLCYLDNAGLLAVGTGSGDIHLLSPQSLRVVQTLSRAHELTVFSVAEVGRQLFSCGRDGKIRSWATAPPFAQGLHLDAHASTVNALLHDAMMHQLISVGRDREIRLWRIEGDGQLVLAKALVAGRDEGHANSVNACCLLSNGRFATGSDDRTVRVWSSEP